jgi:hypothetical protein
MITTNKLDFFKKLQDKVEIVGVSGLSVEEEFAYRDLKYEFQHESSDILREKSLSGLFNENLF